MSAPPPYYQNNQPGNPSAPNYSNVKSAPYQNYSSGPSAPVGYAPGSPAHAGYPPRQSGYPPGPSVPTGYPPGPTVPTGYSPGPAVPTGYPPGSSGPAVYPPRPSVSTGYPPGSSGPTGYPSGQPGHHPNAPPSGYPNPVNPSVQSGYQSTTASARSQSMASSSLRSHQPPPASTTACTSKIEFRISCKNLLDRDITSKSDPMVVVSIKYGNTWYEIGRTENIKNCLNPEFSKPILFDYHFEEIQHARFEVYDLDNTTPELSDDDFLGQAQCTVGEIVSSKTLSRNLLFSNKSRAGNGSITVSVDEVESEGNEVIILSFSAKGLDKKDFFGKSDPFLEIKRKMPNGTWQLCFRTEYIKQNLNPNWRTFELPRRSLCGKNPEEEIKIMCYDYDNDGGHDFIGECTTSFVEMSKGSQQTVTWSLINPKKLAKKGNSYKGSGTLILNKSQVMRVYSFLDFITTGTKLNFIVAVDFTASNGDPRNRESLHYIDPYRPNEYMQAIKAVGTVLQDYDSDKMFPALGFGAKIPPHYHVSHEFALNFNLANPFCSGVEGLLEAYSSCIQEVQLYGPTNVSPMIEHAMKFALHAYQQSEPNDYFVLLILTDGVITDMHNTTTSIVNASRLPLSIIIVGVGGANFHDMNVLDGDGQVLRSPAGIAAARDIVQFVPFRKYSNVNPALLSQEVLAEIPKQVTEYYKSRNLSPKTISSSQHQT